MSISMQMKRRLLLALIIVPSGMALAASFDCANTRTRVEGLICENPRLSRLDTELASAYETVIGQATPAKKTDLIAEQRSWIREVRDKCSNQDCLINAYSARKHTLTFFTTSKSTAEYLVDRQDFEKQVSSFEHDLNSSGVPGKLSSCKLVVHLVDQTTQDQDPSYGGICTLNARDVMVCNDTMVGKLTLKLYGFTESADELADFTSENCSPGG
jgi:uncharacterized protein